MVKPSPNKTDKRSVRRKTFFKRLVRLGLLAGLWGFIGLFFVAAYFYITLPDMDDIKTIEKNPGVEIYDRQNQRLARFGQTRGETVIVDKIPNSLKHAVISIEDRRFYDHPGLDLIGISRAMMTNVAEGGLVQGGSTLTQQLAKNLFLEPDKTLSRKIQEAMLAIWLESELTKDEILTAYLNRVYFGAGAYGITAAANRYYSVKPENLTLAQSAQLAAALRAPSRINPINGRSESIERAGIVLDAMVEEEYITTAEADKARANLKNQNNRRGDITDDLVPHYYTDWVLDQVPEYTSRVRDGLNVYTAHDTQIYEAAKKHIDELFQSRAAEKNIGQVAVVLMEYDGTVRMVIGGKSYAKSQYNRATQAMRQPGSSFKPVVYLTAMQKGHRPSTLVWDAEFDAGDKYRPSNFGNKYYGEVSIADAMALSLNTAAVRLAQDAGMSAVIDTARKLGIETEIKPELASALGASETQLMQLATAYAVIANGGRAVYPYSIMKVTNQDGDTVYDRKISTSGPRVFDESDIRDLKYMMRGVVQHGTAKSAYLQDVRDQGGKTGSSQDYRDALYMGFADGYVMGVWMGNDNNAPMKGVTGGSEPARLWRAIMQDALRIRPVNYRAAIASDGGWGAVGLFDTMLRNLTGGTPNTAVENRGTMRQPVEPEQENRGSLFRWNGFNGEGGFFDRQPDRVPDSTRQEAQPPVTQEREIFGQEIEVESEPANAVEYNN